MPIRVHVATVVASRALAASSIGLSLVHGYWLLHTNTTLLRLCWKVVMFYFWSLDCRPGILSTLLVVIW